MTVLMLHGVGRPRTGADPFHLFVPAPDLARFLAALADRGHRPLTLDDYLRGHRRGILLTFDDGYAGLLTEALPVLREANWPATVFVLTGLLGGTSRWMPEMPDEPLLEAAGVRALSAAGLDVELHGADHTDLAGASPAVLRRNVGDAADELAALTGRFPRVFAYPYGSHDAAARRAVAGAGFRAGFAVHRGHGRFARPRVDVNGTDVARTVLVKTRPWYPAARRLTGAVPGLRPALHTLLGRADEEVRTG